MTEPSIAHIIRDMNASVSSLFGPDFDVILFGSYARGDAEEGSDIDLMYLVDSSQSEISAKSWQIGDAAGDLLVKHGVLVSPIVENRGYFTANTEILPFFRNVNREGVRFHG